MVRVMPEVEIGVWALFISVTSILELLRNGFIRNPLITHLVSATSDEERRDIVSASFALHTILVGLVTIFLLAGAKPLTSFWNAPDLDILFYIYVVRGIVLIPCLHFEYLQQCKMQFKGIFIGTTVRNAPLGLYSMFAYLIGHRATLVELSIVMLVSAIVSAFIAYTYVKDMPIFSFPVNKQTIKRLSGFGKYTLGTTISSMVVKSTDQWMIGRMIGTVGVAMYNPALRISNLVEVPTLAIASLVYPQVNQKMKDMGHEGIQNLYNKSVSLILAIMLPMILPMYLLSDFVINIIFGETYAEAAPILRVTIFYTLIIPFNRQFGTIMDALKRPKINFYLLVMMGVINVVLNYFLLKSMGPVGSAYATLISYIIIFILNQVILYRLYGINTWRVITTMFEWYKVGWDLVWGRAAKFIGR